VFQTLAPPDGDATGGRRFSQKRSEQGRFANARLSSHEDDLTLTL